MAAVARRVYAIERDPAVLARSDRREACWPANLIVICADALTTSFPTDVTTAILLMRHCTREHFAAYLQRLSVLRRCRRLITNARWKMDVEVIDLRSGERVRSRSGGMVRLPLRLDRFHAGRSRHDHTASTGGSCRCGELSTVRNVDARQHVMVNLVIVSHSPALASGVAELAQRHDAAAADRDCDSGRHRRRAASAGHERR